jgi:hypothetical protein
LAQSLPPPRQGLGVPQPKGPRVLTIGVNPTHAPKAMPENKMIPDRY